MGLPSSHASRLFPAESTARSPQTFQWQLGRQSSLFEALAASQSSFGSTIPLPQLSVDLQLAEQPSPPTVFPSSQTSPAAASRRPLPQLSFDLQSEAQPSPLTLPPSSQTSFRSTIPFPHSSSDLQSA